MKCCKPTYKQQWCKARRLSETQRFYRVLFWTIVLAAALLLAANMSAQPTGIVKLTSTNGSVKFTPASGAGSSVDVSVQASTITNGQTNVNLTGSFSGNGSGLTNTGAPSSWNVSFWGDSLTCCGGTGGPYGNLCTNYISTILPIVEGFSGQNSTYISNYFSTNQSQWSNTTVFWAGRNDSGFAAGVPGTVLSNTQWMVSQLLFPSNYIVLGLLTSTNDTPPVIANYLACNVILSNAFWPRYVDAHAMLQSNANGGTNDAYYVAQGWTPFSLLAAGDPLHLNAAGYSVIASNVCLFLSNQFYSRPVRMSSLSSLVSNYVVPVSGLAKATINPYIFSDSGGLQAAFGNNAANELLQFSTATFAYPNAALFGNNSQTWANAPAGGVLVLGVGGSQALGFNGGQISSGSGWVFTGATITNSTLYNAAISNLNVTGNLTNSTTSTGSGTWLTANVLYTNPPQARQMGANFTIASTAGSAVNGVLYHTNGADGTVITNNFQMNAITGLAIGPNFTWKDNVYSNDHIGFSVTVGTLSGLSSWWRPLH